MQVTIITFIIDAFVTVTKGLLMGLENLEVGGRVETIQTTSLGPFVVRALRARVYQREMAIKDYSAFPKSLALVKPHHQIVKCPIQSTRWESNPSAEMQPTWLFLFSVT